MWPIKEKEHRQLLIKWPTLIPLYLALIMCRYGSLIKINLSDENKKDKIGLINDPLSQIHSLASSEHCFLFVLFARF